MAYVTAPIVRPDGRRLRSERSQAAVVDAMLDLYREGVLRPGAAEIARRAGVSERTVFRLFDDLESLTAKVLERQTARVGHLFAAPDNSGGREERIDALLAQRLTLYEEIAPVLRAARLCLPASAAAREAVQARRRLLRRQVERQFRPELDCLCAADRVELAMALDVTVGLETIELLRATEGLAPTETRGVLRRMVRALLDDAEGYKQRGAAPSPGPTAPPPAPPPRCGRGEPEPTVSPNSDGGDCRRLRWEKRLP
jgi:AcrR family transcriptional regulator